MAEISDTRMRVVLTALVIALVASLGLTCVSWYYTWQIANEKAEIGKALAEQVVDECEEDDLDPDTAVCENAEDIKDEDPEIVEGLQGRQGDPGPPGLPGRPGEPGQDGRDGTPGRDGRPGEPGRNGLDGTDGQDGPPGGTGPQGDPGPPGPQGDPGPPGQDGQPGKDGTVVPGDYACPAGEYVVAIHVMQDGTVNLECKPGLLP